MRLNEPTEKFREYCGKNTEQMPKLIADNRVPMSVAGLMQRRLELRNSDDTELKTSWNDHYFDTGDGVLYMPDGSLVIAYDAQALRSMTSKSRLVGGALHLEDMGATDIEGVTYTPKELGKIITGRNLTLKEAREHQIWRSLARGDKTLSDAYTEMVFTDHKERFGYDTNMEVYLGSSSDTPKMRAWYVGGECDRSKAYGYCDLNDVGGGRLVGLVSETQE